MNRVEELALVCGFTLPGEATQAELDALADISATLPETDEQQAKARLLKILGKLERD